MSSNESNTTLFYSDLINEERQSDILSIVDF